MSSILFTRLPFSVNDPSLPQLDSTQVNVLVDYEVGALDHWVFNQGSASLTGLTSGTIITNANAAVSPDAVFGPNYIEFPMDAENHYSTQFMDADIGAEGCYAAVIYVDQTTFDAGDLAIFLGNLDTSGAASTGGSMYLTGSLGLTHNVRGMTTTSANTGTTLQGGKWYFVAGSYKAGQGVNNFVGKTAGYGFAGTGSSGSRTYNTVDPVGIGNPTYSTSSADSGVIRYAEFAIYDQYFYETDYPALYARAKERMAAQGITVE